VITINVRLMGTVSRLRQYVHAKHDAAKNNRVQEAGAYTAQISSIEQRAEMIRRCFLLVLVSLAGAVASCLLLGFVLYYWASARILFHPRPATSCLTSSSRYYLSLMQGVARTRPEINNRMDGGRSRSFVPENMP
jgi:hypothetical protein